MKFSSVNICACYQGLGHFSVDGANLQMQTHLEPNIYTFITNCQNCGIFVMWKEQKYTKEAGFGTLEKLMSGHFNGEHYN